MLISSSLLLEKSAFKRQKAKESSLSLSPSCSIYSRLCPTCFFVSRDEVRNNQEKAIRETKQNEPKGDPKRSEEHDDANKKRDHKWQNEEQEQRSQGDNQRKFGGTNSFGWKMSTEQPIQFNSGAEWQVLVT